MHLTKKKTEKYVLHESKAEIAKLFEKLFGKEKWMDIE